LELAFVGDIASYPAFKKLLSDILDIGYGKLSVYCLTNDFLRYIQDNKDWKNDSISYTVLVSDYSAIDEHISIIKQLPISFIFLVRSEEDYEHATSCIERNELANIEIAPIYTEDNLSFFEDNLYMDEEDISEIELSKPEIIKQGSRYGMKLKSKAATTYMIKIDIESTFEPIIGSKQQAESFIDYLNHNGNDKEAIFSCDVFGRKLGDLIEEGMYYKLNMIPENASLKIHDILSKIVNKGKSNVIAIVL